MNRKIIEIIKVIDELMFEMFIKNRINHRNLSVCDIKKLIKAINGGHPWSLMVKPIEMQILLQCCEIDENPFHTMANRIKQLNMKQNQFEFKPFDQVLVRYDGQSEWTAGIYSRIGKNAMDRTVHICAGGGLPYNECIPYNEETAHLLGTTKPYEQPKPKEYHVIFIAENGDRHQVPYTADEFKQFIIDVVLNNKDVQNFDVRRINN